MTPKVTQPLYKAFVKPIVKHAMYFTVGMRVLTMEAAKSNVYMKATKDSKLKILKEYCDDVKIECDVMNEIMLKYHNLPVQVFRLHKV